MRNQAVLQVGIGIAFVTASLSVATAAAQPSTDKDMVPIRKGEFTMGSNEHSDEVRHQVVLDAYLIDKYEVSNTRYKEFMKATGHPAPAYWDDPRLSQANQPVVGVTWTDANAFCKWEGKRLPTEAEWERAAKGPDGDNHYPWGHRLDPTKANYGQNVGRTMPVDSYPEGVSGFGVYNMAGNVFEWVEDWYDPKYYKQSMALNPHGAEKGYNFANQGPSRCCAAAHGWRPKPPSIRATGFGISRKIIHTVLDSGSDAPSRHRRCPMKPSKQDGRPSFRR